MWKDPRFQVSGVSTTASGNMKEEKDFENLCVLCVSVVKFALLFIGNLFPFLDYAL